MADLGDLGDLVHTTEKYLQSYRLTVTAGDGGDWEVD